MSVFVIAYCCLSSITAALNVRLSNAHQCRARKKQIKYHQFDRTKCRLNGTGRLVLAVRQSPGTWDKSVRSRGIARSAGSIGQMPHQVRSWRGLPLDFHQGPPDPPGVGIASKRCGHAVLWRSGVDTCSMTNCEIGNLPVN